MNIRGNDILFSMRGIRKSFSDVEVLHGIDFDLRKGEIHALIGENGAGKSTLSKIITANEKCDAGTMYFKGKQFAPETPKAAIDIGVAMVHQEFNLAPALTIAQNVFLASEPKWGLFVDEAEMIRNAQKILDQLNLDVPVTTPVKYLTTYQQQLTEIAKCIASNSDIMILDEPTAPLSEKETKLLFKIMRDLKEKGIAILFISHRLEEVFQMSDRVSVLRDGDLIATFDTHGVDRNMVIKCMIGRDLSQMFQHTSEHRTIDYNEIVLKVTDLNSKKKRLRDISFQLHKGEILGFAGLVGAGRSEVMRAIIGEDPFDSGTIEFKGKVMPRPNLRQLYDQGLGYVPEDRKLCGIIANLDVTANITLTVIPRFKHGLLVSAKEERQGTQEIVDLLAIRCSNLRQKLRNLSGGNQQKTVLGRSIIMRGDVLILDEPTRGVDIGAKVEIYNIIVEFCKAGGSVILVSSEQLEILGVCDRAIVMCEGRVTGNVMRKDFSEELLADLSFRH